MSKKTRTHRFKSKKKQMKINTIYNTSMHLVLLSN